MNAVLVIMFATAATGLGAETYPERERAEARLRFAWPLSTPAVRAACGSPDPEVRLRAIKLACEADDREARLWHLALALRPPGQRWLAAIDPRDVRWDVVKYASALPKGDLALKILYLPPEKTKLPWLPGWVHKEYGTDRELRRTLCKIAREFWGDVQLACDPDIDAYGTGGDNSNLYGVDNLRFWLRGLPDPQWDAKTGRWVTFEEVEAMEARCRSQRRGIIKYPDLPDATPHERSGP